ncbi:TPA: pentapeptide repeat-containing protein [Burkholderia multivorans]|nr:pentapeptide repeat-containing protein [Burkholderia multivorans]HDR9840139.1 pentapeptide repeat-containing protein [Burkholderia multivorans]HDR9846727.1 pentapeptide repeat-containing protein [Burkholderia multivorans]HDR9853137.1 pentapeptide repeat-containing protein [Burkholderia multivorans]
MKIEILNCWTLKVIFEYEADSMKIAVEMACKQGTNLRGADLRGADLRGADLRGANLRGADLSGANLRGADLRDADLSDADLRGADLRDADLSDADLRGADLSGANLRGADLSGANLRGAYLRGANLRGANLRGADLRGANLRGADLSDADLLPIKADFIEVISQAPREVPALIDALKAGRVDGSTYSGECACLVGTIANARGIDVYSAELGIPKDESRPAERFFLAIRKGDTPETNAASKLALEWAETWLDTQRKAFAS